MDQPDELFAALKGRKARFRFDAAQGGGEHCEVGSPGLTYDTVFDWLEEMWG